MSYAHHRLRVDNPGLRLIIDFQDGALIYVDMIKRQYARVTLEDMVSLRDKQVKTFEETLPRLAPEVRQQMKAQIAEMRKAARQTIDAKPTGEKAKIMGLACEIFTWTMSNGSGKACIATKLPFDARPFRKDSLQLSKKMAQLGAGTAATSMAVLHLGAHGFPLKIEQTLRMGANELNVVSTFEELKSKRFPKSHFLPPKGFKKRDFEALMKESVAEPAIPPVGP